MNGQLAVTVVNDLSELARLSQEVEKFGGTQGFTPKVVRALNVSLDEIISNTIAHGYADKGRHEILVRVQVDGDHVRAEVEDDGRAFNPLHAPEPDTKLPLEKCPVGGLGVLLVRKMMDVVEYRREHGKNLLVMKKRLMPDHERR